MLMPRFSNGQILLRLIEKEVKSSHNLKDNNNTKDNLKNNNNPHSDTKSKASIDDLINLPKKLSNIIINQISQNTKRYLTNGLIENVMKCIEN